MGADCMGALREPCRGLPLSVFSRPGSDSGTTQRSQTVTSRAQGQSGSRLQTQWKQRAHQSWSGCHIGKWGREHPGGEWTVSTPRPDLLWVGQCSVHGVPLPPRSSPFT